MNEIMRRVAAALTFTLAPVLAQQPLNPPLKNWPAPLYWAPTHVEFEQQRVLQSVGQSIGQRIAHPAGSSALAQAGTIFAPPGPMTFIAVTPCRVMDTRSSQPFTGVFGPPSLSAYVTRQVPVPGSSCGIPSNAGAYSLNVTVVPPGALSFLTVWPAGQPYPVVSTLNDPVSGGVVANAAIVVAGTSGAIQMVAGNPTDVIVDINGYYAAPTDGSSNTAIGQDAMLSNTTGSYDTSTGVSALAGNTTGSNNTANGANALAANTTGNENTASGSSALENNTTGVGNTANGYFALVLNTTGNGNTGSGDNALAFNTTGGANTASGFDAMQYNATGSNNTASGTDALYNNTTGSNNIAIGAFAAYNVAGDKSNNIHIGTPGITGDSATIRIGNPITHTSLFAAGITGVNVSGVPVVVSSSGQLGVVSSSRVFKEDIQDMGDSSSGLMRLRPVTFRYKQPYEDGSKPIDYGLIAEEVAKVYPDLVAYSPSGEVQTVQYQKVNAMLLNEVQKQHQEIRDLKNESSAEIAALKAHLAELEKQIEILAPLK
jgi:hypothetical protein